MTFRSTHLRRLLFSLAVGLSAMPLAVALWGQGSKPPLPPEVLASEQILDPSCGLALSSDGKFVAYASRDGRKQQALSSSESDFLANGTPLLAVNCDLSVTEIQTGKTRNITEGTGSNWAPVWSPDGTRLAFYSDKDGSAQLWAWDRATNSKRKISNV